MNVANPLLRPLKIKDVTFRNRVFSTAHASGTAVGGLPKERYQLYHLEKIKGGMGLTICGAAAVASDSVAPSSRVLDASRDDVIPHFERFAQRIHKHGGLLICQLSHKGANSVWDSEPWLPAVSASQTPAWPVAAKAMEEHDIGRIQLAFAWAMRRCRDGGIDGCEIPFGGDLILQFLSPLTNRRDDAYGGNLQGRLRFARELLEAGRKMVGGEFLIGAQFSAGAFEAAGLADDDMLRIAATLEGDGCIDYFNVGAREPFSLAAIDHAADVTADLQVAAAVKRGGALPVFCGGDFRDVATAAQAVESASCDMVAMSRAYLAEPHLINKQRGGIDETIRPCVGAGFCLDRSLQGLEILCLHNPATGREALLSHAIGKSKEPNKKIVVIGAGPAGLEAARVCAARGHSVILYEKQATTGGQIKLAASVPGRARLAGISEWLESQVRLAGVELRLKCAATLDALQNDEPDIIVVATGGTARQPAINGTEYTTATWEILSGEAAPAGSVLVCDQQGGHQALSCATFIATRGGLVELASRGRRAGQNLGPASLSDHLRPLYANEVAFSADLALREVYPEDGRLVAVLRNEITLAEEERLVDQIVVECGTLPDDALYGELRQYSTNLGETDLDALASDAPQRIAVNRGGWFQLFRIGDAVAGRDIHAALYEALRLCRQL